MNLREARFKRQFTQYHLVLKTGIPQSKISLIERGFIEPREAEKIKIARALHLKTNQIEWEYAGLDES